MWVFEIHPFIHAVVSAICSFLLLSSIPLHENTISFTHSLFFYLIMSLYKWKTRGYKYWIFESKPFSVQSREPQVFVNGALTPTWAIRHILLLLVVNIYSSIISTSVEREWEEHWPESQETWVLRALPLLSNITGHFISRPQFLHQENGLVGLDTLSPLPSQTSYSPLKILLACGHLIPFC